MKDFKDLFEDDLVWLDQCEDETELEDLAENMFYKEYNYNNCDVSSGQFIYSYNEILANLEEIKEAMRELDDNE